MNKISLKVTVSFRMSWNLDDETCLIICTAFPTLNMTFLVKKSLNDRFKQPWSGGTQVWFDRDVPLWNLKVDPYKYPFLQEKSDPCIYQLMQFGQNFGQNHPIFPKFLKFEPNLAQIWENLEKLTHSYTKFCVL